MDKNGIQKLNLDKTGGSCMDYLPGIIAVAIGGFVLYLIIANAVKIGVREALSEFKEEIIKDIKDVKDIKDINLKNSNEENKIEQ